ncbi:LacI family DNA-binding transcriptional regulator [Paraglaciecola sp. 2405UD69-4]|uniref:LacI family DNA-binding transcriptional regulator n=1 Tax=Paraglaciecola sp. 2405UD69-4 TaxID=3391836 RepID=UPI0039C9DEFC
MSKIKLIDVANLAGVSKSTASQYLNGRFEYMSQKTKDRISEAIKELDYVPNPIARSLKSDKTKTIGVVVRDITGFDTSRVIRGIDDFCKSGEYNVLIYNTDFDPEVEARSIQALHQLRVDGLIIASSGNNTSLIRDYQNKGLPIVQFQLEHDHTDKSIVISDYKTAAYEATDYLIKLGHNRICFVTQNFESVKSRSERFQGYVAALDKHNIPLDESLIEYWRRGTGLVNSITNIINVSKPPTALFSQHLAITTDLLSELANANINIPDDISLVGFDELPMAKFFKVPVTVVKQDPYKIGTETAKLLLEHIKDTSLSPKKILVPCKLVERHSCRNLKRG